jgi:hypothetical protein
MLANVGRSSRTDNVYIEGQTDARTRQFLMTLWDGGGNALKRPGCHRNPHGRREDVWSRGWG